jgi:hypothetical protein
LCREAEGWQCQPDFTCKKVGLPDAGESDADDEAGDDDAGGDADDEMADDAGED